MPEKSYVVVIRPKGEVAEAGLLFTKRQAVHYCTMFNRVMKGDHLRAEMVMVKIRVSLPSGDPARERSR